MQEYKLIIKGVLVLIAIMAIVILTGLGIGFATFRMNNYGELVVFIWVSSWFITIFRYSKEIWKSIINYLKEY